MIPDNETVIYSLFVLHKESGIAVFIQNFTPFPTNMDMDIIGGFLIAILNFAQEVAQQSIELIQLSQLKISYTITSKFVFILFSDFTLDQIWIKKKLNTIQETFYQKYEESINNFYGNINLFKNFAPDVESILNKETQSISYMKSSEDVIQNLFQASQERWQNIQKLISEKANACEDVSVTECFSSVLQDVEQHLLKSKDNKNDEEEPQ